MSGHSKWSQIKHKKGAADAKRGQLFGRLVKEITVAAREGGVSPEANARLRSAMERAQDEGMPKDNIERAIARASGTNSDTQLVEILCEASAAGGAAIIIEAITDSRNRTINEIKHVLSEYGAKLAEPGSLMWNFEKIGIIEIAAADNTAKTKEEVENAIIESGASDFREEDGTWIVETAYPDTDKVRAILEQAGIAVKNMEHRYRPRTTVSLPPDAQETLEKLLDALSDHDDIQEIYTNTL